MADDVSGLKTLGAKTTVYHNFPHKGIIECFLSPTSEDYTVVFETEEFTSLCPKTGQPDFGSIEISYRPNKLCIESKSLKLYLFAFRGFQGFMESITNKIAEDLAEACQPKWLLVVGNYAKRGGVGIQISREIFG